jgi:hypothetical protein
MTRYAYDPETFRLKRLRSERYEPAGELAYQPIGVSLQDLAYEYDLVGNITVIHDRTPECGIPNTPLGADALDRAFTYDAIYRLRSATGRECDLPTLDPPWQDQPRCIDLTRTRAYTERYKYDRVGNMLDLKHGNGSGGFTRKFSVEGTSNRLRFMEVNGTAYEYTYDPNGFPHAN